VATERALTTVRGALDRVRAISSMLRPAVLDDLGLEQAVRTVLSEFTTRTGVDGQLEIEMESARIPDAVAGHIYRILQEALTNVARHASASTVFVNLRATGERIELSVKDDGAGFSTSDVPTSRRFGLLGMRERSELMGGSFRLESAPGTGATIHVSIPLKPAPEPP
jgi:signal transduction histidine kinase